MPPIVVKEGTSISEEVNIVNCFNDHFINRSAFLDKTVFGKNNFNDLGSMLSTTLVESFQIECVTPHEVNQYIQELNPNKSTGIDGIGPIILKKVEMQFLQSSLV